jgi:ribosomal protein L40E
MSTTITALICPGCGERNAADAFSCTRCGRVLNDIRPAAARIAASGPPPASADRYAQQAPLLRLLGAVVMVLGVLGALWIIVKFGTEPASMVDAFTGGERRASPIAWGIAFATVLNSVVVGSMCIGIAVTIENSAAIRNRLEAGA